MICQYCGTEMEGDSHYCRNCGKANDSVCKHCGAQREAGVVYCRNCGKAFDEPKKEEKRPVREAVYDDSDDYEIFAYMPMKWFKFLIYFSLFAGAVLNVISGIRLLSGKQYGYDTELYYSIMDGLQGLDKFMGFAALIMAVLAIIARFRLAGFYENGPRLLMGLYGLNIVISVVYFIGLNCIDVPFYFEINTTGAISSIVSSVIMYFANLSYFRKRDHLFYR